jgi:hypothetical protein
MLHRPGIATKLPQHQQYHPHANPTPTPALQNSNAGLHHGGSDELPDTLLSPGSKLGMREMLLRETARHESVRQAMVDPAQAESGIIQRACQRLEEIIGELGMDPSPELLQMACQAAEILLMMRQEDEPPSDFQVRGGGCRARAGGVGW